MFEANQRIEKFSEIKAWYDRISVGCSCFLNEVRVVVVQGFPPVGEAHLRRVPAFTLRRRQRSNLQQTKKLHQRQIVKSWAIPETGGVLRCLVDLLTRARKLADKVCGFCHRILPTRAFADGFLA